MAIRAFPTAEGFGANAIGGRGGRVIEVTNLNDSGAGSLRDAAQVQSGPRTVVFRIGGTINLAAPLKINHPFCTIAGQTAPGDGIQLKNASLQIVTNDVIVRFIRVRSGLDLINPSVGLDIDTILVWGGGVVPNPAQNVITDHCTAMWSTDQTCDAYGSVTVTHQWNLIAEGLNVGHSITLDSSGNRTKGPNISHSDGSIIGADPYTGPTIRVTYHHCLWAQCGDRLPLMNPLTDAYDGTTPIMQVELVNNVVYDWLADGGGMRATLVFDSNAQFSAFPARNAGHPPAGQINLIGNTYRKGPNTNSDNGVGWCSPYIQIYAKDNIGPASTNAVDGFSIPIHRTDCSGTSGLNLYAKWPNYDPFSPYVLQTNTPFSFPLIPATISPAATNYDTVLDNAGCSSVVRNGVRVSIRDAVDTRIVSEVRNRTGQVGGSLTYAQWSSGGNLTYPTIANGTPPADSDHDGISDAWAIANNVPVGGAQLTASNGYTYLENYINELAGDFSSGTIIDTIPPTVPTGLQVI